MDVRFNQSFRFEELPHFSEDMSYKVSIFWHHSESSRVRLRTEKTG